MDGSSEFRGLEVRVELSASRPFPPFLFRNCTWYVHAYRGYRGYRRVKVITHQTNVDLLHFVNQLF